MRIEFHVRILPTDRRFTEVYLSEDERSLFYQELSWGGKW